MPSSQVQTATAAMLEAIGLQDVNDADTSQQGVILRALNSAIDDLAIFAPAKWFGADEFAAVLASPSSVSLDVTQNSKTFTSTDIDSGASNMMGQAIVISGDGITNRLVRSGSTKLLLVPYGGSTGTRDATIYYDTASMPSDFKAFKGVLRIIGGDRINIVDNALDLGEDPFSSIPVGTPTAARMSIRTDGSGYRSTFLRFNALPATAIRIHFEYYRRPASIATLNDDRNDLVPQHFVHSILSPVCIQRLAGITDAVVIDPAKIDANYRAALAIMSQATDQEPFMQSVSLSNSIHRH